MTAGCGIEAEESLRLIKRQLKPRHFSKLSPDSFDQRGHFHDAKRLARGGPDRRGVVHRIFWHILRDRPPRHHGDPNLDVALFRVLDNNVSGAAHDGFGCGRGARRRRPR